MRKNATHLTEEQMWSVVKYCIEHKGITQDENGDFLKFRVSQKNLVEEISRELFIITPHSLTKSIQWHKAICDLFGNKPIAPPPQESVQEDMLKIEVAKLKNEINNLTEMLNRANNIANNQGRTILEFKNRLDQIKKLVIV